MLVKALINHKIKTMDDNKNLMQDSTPATLKIALVFFLCITYFTGEIYFWSSEYYVETPPYLAILLIALILSYFIYIFLQKREPERTDAKKYIFLAYFGFALLTYAFIPRVNILTDTNGLKDYVYELDKDNVWQSTERSPPVDIYLSQSKYWQQFKTGDQYILQLRKGGLGIWLVNMEQIYKEQKKYYDCDDFKSCMLVDSIDLSNQ